MGVELREIVMDFPGTRALDGVTCDIRLDEVHGLIGENGAGKIHPDEHFSRRASANHRCAGS